MVGQELTGGYCTEQANKEKKGVEKDLVGTRLRKRKTGVVSNSV